MGIIVLLCGICLVFGCFRTCSSGACMGLEFTFPQLKNDTFSVQEHNNETFSFEVRGKRCRNVSFLVIKDTCIGDSPTASRKTLCLIHQDYLKDGKCVCERHTDSGPRLTCNFTDEFDRDVGELVFQSKPKTPGKSKCVRINVLYPATISNFTTTPSHELRENETVVVNCSWVNGNPQPRILIRNPKNQTIVSQHPDNQVLNAAIFEGNTTCSDSGQYGCEVEGTDQYKAVDLMVKCPPRIMNDTEEKAVVLGSNAAFQFDVFSYNNLTVCTLEGPKRNGPRNCFSDKTEIQISGTPPRLRLEIKVKNAREDDEGTWRLTVDNGFTDNAGVPVHSAVSFTLHVYSQYPPVSPGMSAMIGVVGFLTLVIVVLVLSVVYFRKKSQRKSAINSTRNSDSQGDPDRVSGHSYEEVPDSAAPRPPRCHHHGQGQTSRPGRLPTAPTGPAVDSPPEDYLHPVNSQPASSRTNQPHDAPATPGGPYDSLEMSDVGLRSPYSQLGM